MKIRTKITFIVIYITFLFVFLSNIAFGKFFSNYLEDQEEAQVKSISHNIECFLNERNNQYRGSVNDWSHWDDTYNFMNNNYENYMENHLTENTFTNLELNFVILIDKENKVKSKQFYDSDDKKLTKFPHDLNEDIGKVIKYSKSKEDTSSILKLGDEFYFVAVSEITDTNLEEKSNGKMIFGRLIDKSIIENLEKITGSQISFSTLNSAGDDISKEVSHKGSRNDLINIVKFNKDKDTMVVKLVSKNILGEDDYILLTLTKTRDLFLSGMDQIYKFMFIYGQIMLFILFIVFTLLGRYISKPITKLINEVKDLDLTKSETQKLKVYGKDEFSFLRNSINSMLSKIEAEQIKVRENKEKLHSTLASVGDGVIAVDKNGIVEFMNDKAQKLTGWTQEEAYGKTFESIFKVINEHTKEEIESSVQKVFEIKETVELDNHAILISKDGLERAIEDTAAPIIDMSGKVIGVVLVFRDISEKKEKRNQIEFLSYHDQLTGVYNRRYFEESIERLDKITNLPLSVIYTDVNGLKTINDAFGHEYGDLLIQQVADVLKAEFRTSDIISRTGGDEFVILLPKTEGEVAQNLINIIKEKIEKKMVMNINTSASFGLDTKNNESQSIWSILKSAEDLMYQNKIINSSSKRSGAINSIINTLHLKYPKEEIHAKRVSNICQSIGKAYNLSDSEIKELKIAGRLHDIGKIALNEAILNNSSKLSKNEWREIKRHPETGYRLLCTSREYYNIAEYVLLHHERWDGQGYPKGLKGEAIPWKARVITIADSYAAMTCERPYRKALSQEEAVEEIKKNVNIQFDPDIARTFVEKVLGMDW